MCVEGDKSAGVGHSDEVQPCGEAVDVDEVQAVLHGGRNVQEYHQGAAKQPGAVEEN